MDIVAYKQAINFSAAGRARTCVRGKVGEKSGRSLLGDLVLTVSAKPLADLRRLTLLEVSNFLADKERSCRSSNNEGRLAGFGYE